MRVRLGRVLFPPWPGPGGFGHGPGQGGRLRTGSRPGPGSARGRRPNVRAAVLALLNERPMHGYEMITELETRTGGIWRPSPGSVYPTLQLLEDEGLIISEEAGGRKRFTLTDAGRAEAERPARRRGRTSATSGPGELARPARRRLRRDERAASGDDVRHR